MFASILGNVAVKAVRPFHADVCSDHVGIGQQSAGHIVEILLDRAVVAVPGVTVAIAEFVDVLARYDRLCVRKVDQQAEPDLGAGRSETGRSHHRDPSGRLRAQQLQPTLALLPTTPDLHAGIPALEPLPRLLGGHLGIDTQMLRQAVQGRIIATDQQLSRYQLGTVRRQPRIGIGLGCFVPYDRIALMFEDRTELIALTPHLYPRAVRLRETEGFGKGCSRRAGGNQRPDTQDS